MVKESPVDRKVGAFGFGRAGRVRVRRSAAADFIPDPSRVRVPRGGSLGGVRRSPTADLIPSPLGARFLRGAILGGGPYRLIRGLGPGPLGRLSL